MQSQAAEKLSGTHGPSEASGYPMGMQRGRFRQLRSSVGTHGYLARLVGTQWVRSEAGSGKAQAAEKHPWVPSEANGYPMVRSEAGSGS